MLRNYPIRLEKVSARSPVTSLFAASLGAEQSSARFQFDSPNPVPDERGWPLARRSSDRWETLTNSRFGLHFTPPSPLSFDLAYGPGISSGDFVHRAEIGVSCKFR